MNKINSNSRMNLWVSAGNSWSLTPAGLVNPDNSIVSTGPDERLAHSNHFVHLTHFAKLQHHIYFSCLILYKYLSLRFKVSDSCYNKLIRFDSNFEKQSDTLSSIMSMFKHLALDSMEVVVLFYPGIRWNIVKKLLWISYNNIIKKHLYT